VRASHSCRVRERTPARRRQGPIYMMDGESGELGERGEEREKRSERDFSRTNQPKAYVRQEF